MSGQVLVTWEHKEHHFAMWNEAVYCPVCGHRGQWELSHRASNPEGDPIWRPYYRYCPSCKGQYEMPRSFRRSGDPWEAKESGASAMLDRVLHEKKTVELLAVEEKLLDGGAVRE